MSVCYNIVLGEGHHKITQDNIPVFSGFDNFLTPINKDLSPTLIWF
jgi:hypothetical protein